MASKRKPSKIWIVFAFCTVILLVLSACGGGSPTEAPATAEATEAPTNTPVAEGYVPVSDEADGATVISAGIIYTVVGADEVTSEILDNDIVRYVIDGEIVQGYARYPLSIYQGESWSGVAKFDGINQNLEVLFNTTCTGGDNVTLDTSTNVTVTCANDTRDWEIQITFRVSVLSTSGIAPAATQVNVVEWQNLEEGSWYLFCPAPGTWYVKYTPENTPARDWSHGLNCLPGKLINKVAYRIFSPIIDEGGGIATLYPETTLGGYPFIAKGDLIIGRVYYVCSTDQIVTDENDSAIDSCEEGVYIGSTTAEFADFNVGGTNHSYKLTGAFPSPRP